MKFCIIGGGFAGLSCALVARQAGINVTLLEATLYNGYRAGEHLAARGVRLLAKLGVPDSLLSKHALKCYEVSSAWGGQDIYTQDSIFNAFGEGLILSRPDFDLDFAGYVASMGVEIITGAKVTDVRRDTEQWRVKFKKDKAYRKLSTDFVVDASGRLTHLPACFGTKKIRYDSLIAITQYFSSESKVESGKGVITVEAASEGWIYSTRLKDSTCVVSVFTDSETINKIGSIDGALEYVLANSERGMHEFLRFKKIGVAHAVSARSQTLTQVAGTQWLAVGDAAWSADPLSAQGMYKAIRTGMDAGNTINDHYSGCMNALDDYDLRMRNSFNSYLVERTEYYRKETRWSDEPFWSKRHQLSWLQMPINVHPGQHLNVTASRVKDREIRIKALVPSINILLLASVAEESESVLEAVNRYKHDCSDRSSDREIIVAVQSLVG